MALGGPVCGRRRGDDRGGDVCDHAVRRLPFSPDRLAECLRQSGSCPGVRLLGDARLVVGLLLAPVGGETLIWPVAGIGVEVILTVAYALGSVDGAVGRVGPVPFWGIGCAAVGGLWWAIWQERWRWWGVPIVLVGLLAPLTARPPDIIVARDLLAVSDRDGHYWMQGRGGFVRKQWLKETGADPLPWPSASPIVPAVCVSAAMGRPVIWSSSDGQDCFGGRPLRGGDCLATDYGHQPLQGGGLRLVVRI